MFAKHPKVDAAAGKKYFKSQVTCKNVYELKLLNRRMVEHQFSRNNERSIILVKFSRWVLTCFHQRMTFASLNCDVSVALCFAPIDSLQSIEFLHGLSSEIIFVF